MKCIEKLAQINKQDPHELSKIVQDRTMEY